MIAKECGLEFARYCQAVAAGGGAYGAIEQLAARYGDRAPVTRYAQKAAVGGAHLGDDDWGGSIAGSVGREFIAVVSELSVIGRLGLRPAPLNVEIGGIGTGAGAAWRADSKPIPVQQMAFDGAGRLLPLSIAAIAALSAELVKMGDTNAEMWIRDELVRAVVQRLDTDFLLPANAGTAGEKPASILNGLTAIDASTDIDVDLKALIDDFEGDLSRATFVARPEIFTAIAATKNLELLGLRGGELLGAPALASRYAPAGVLALIDPGGIALGDTGIEVETADQASLEMLDSSLEQDGTDGSGAVSAGMVSMWQAGLVGLKIIRSMSWGALRPCASYVTGIAYAEAS